MADRWQRWRALAAGDNDDRFARRLAWDGLDCETARRALFPAHLADHAALPLWVESLRQGLRLATASERSDRHRVDSVRPLPFDDVWQPFVEAARDRLCGQAAHTSNAIDGRVMASFEHRLLHALSNVASRALFHEFRTRYPDRRGGFDRLLSSMLPAHASTRQFDEFVAHLRSGGLIVFFEAYPVLARLVATLADLWVESTTEFLMRLAADRQAIGHEFCGGADPGVVVAIGDAVSDAHNGGRSVLSLTFASGLRLVYKPKDIALERKYFALLSWLNERGAALPFRVLHVLERDGYGWVEFVDHAPCTDAAAVARYYHRAGGLACLLYAMAASDCHFENLLAAGDQPVLVDLETLIQPAPVAMNAECGADERNASVLTTGLLPYWLVNAAGVAHDVSGLGGLVAQPGDVAAWENINTDEMAVAQRGDVVRPRQNVVRLQDVVQSPGDYRDEIVAGFRAMHVLLRSQRAALLAEDGPLQPLATECVRFVFRPTSLYRRVLRDALEPDWLRDGADRSIALDILSRPLLDTAEPNPFWDLRRAEQLSMERLDVPYFSAATNRAGMTLASGEAIEDCFTMSAYARARARIDALDQRNEDLQAAFVGASLRTSIVAAAGHTIPDRPRPGAPLSTMSADAMIGAAVAIARDLEAHAVRLADGSSRWIGVSFSPAVDRYDLAQLGVDLYNGAGGIALFLASVERVTGGAGFRELALAALQPLSDALRTGEPDVPELRAIGGAWGAGSAAYALVRAADLLDAPHLLIAAATAAALITPERIVEDRTLDIMSGSAGAILGLLALHAATGDRLPLDRAAACG